MRRRARTTTARVPRRILQVPRARRQALTDKSTNCEKEAAALKEKLTHVQAASEKVEQDLNEFVRSHMIEAPQ